MVAAESDGAYREVCTLGKQDDVSWHLVRRILFRFSFCYIVLYYLPSVLESILMTAWVEMKYSHLLDRLMYRMIGVDGSLYPSGSGDTTVAYIEQLVILLFALVVGIVWSIVDRRRGSYVRLNGYLWILARYALAFALLSYAFAKIIPIQFLPLQDQRLVESYGQSSPMGLLWSFMGFSMPYTIFAGCAELLPAVLLVFRRTALMGSLIAFAVLLNVVVLNFCYDVPVKLYSLNLLLLSAFLIVPGLPRLFRMFVLDLPVESSSLRVPLFQSIRMRRVALALKSGVLAILLSRMTTSSITRYKETRSQSQPTASPLTTRGFHWIQEEPYNR